MFVRVSMCEYSVYNIRRYFGIICHSQNDESFAQQIQRICKCNIDKDIHVCVHACIATIGTKISTNIYDARIFTSHSHAHTHALPSKIHHRLTNSLKCTSFLLLRPKGRNENEKKKIKGNVVEWKESVFVWNFRSKLKNNFAGRSISFK